MSQVKQCVSMVKGALGPFFLSPSSRKNVGIVLERQAAKRPSQALIRFEDREVTYLQANELANRYARLFLSRGFAKGDTVALLMGNRPEYLIIHAGLAKIGVVPALVNTNIRGRVLAHALNIVEARAVIVGLELAEAYDAVAAEVNVPGPVFVEKEGLAAPTPSGMEDLAPLIADQPDTNPVPPEPVVAADTLEYIYTSGTTGMPKATVLTHRKWFQMGYAAGGFAMNVIPGDVQYLCLPLYHNSGVNIAWPHSLMWGGTVALARKFSAGRFWDDVRRFKASHFIYVGELCRYLYNQPPRPDDKDNPLRVILGNGMRAEYWEAFQERFGIEKVLEVYGATEGVGGLMNRKGVPGMIGQLSLAGIVRMGELARCDVETGEIHRDARGFAQKCAVGETGMFLPKISRINQFSGYKNNKAATSEKILSDVFVPGDRYFLSGDLMQLHDKDYVSFVDRLGDTFKWKGEVVSTNEVGDLLFRFGDIEDANVYGVEVKGSEGRAGMAALTLLPGREIDLAALGAYVAEHLPVYARPWFLRIREQCDVSVSFKQQKVTLRKEGFDPGQIDDPLYFYHPGQGYLPLTRALYDDIQGGEVRF
ncbi:long-chain-acyl-CoA synthetase [Desulfoluna spongiiphila]|uniref:Fatty-acyl-CoA synthase/citronellyl-CoA synthetase n=1 Tax=Desulfoluna spongiiphila TaxID=419481 RepID=A0A1G5CSG4_9BACT|nr:long-chain-acyl-CoA synthetase [Desulfoluna spongiiphila]SCY05405.1 fatty-acyl-CoA synthase/citronellyl-CoA synthetase [Desulfoluna spongiiphila]